jgi:murein DD-endopeptidase
MPSLGESLGLHPLSVRLGQARIALMGAEDVPPSKAGLESLFRSLHPRLAIPLWMGRFLIPRQAIITNLFNRRQTPIEDGWSVRRTQTEDFRGKDLTYDSHNGTDFSIPRGSTVVAPATGQVVRILSEFNRGGLKLITDHGEGLMTCMAHLARTLVNEGDVVRVGEPVAISAYSGLDALITFPFGAPHVHFNVWLDGEPVDPFARAGETSLWLGDFPAPAPPPGNDAEDFTPSSYDAARVEAVIARCRTASVRDALQGISTLAERAAHLISERNYYPTRFPDRGNVYDREHPRRQRLFMPFSTEDFDDAVFYDEL